MHSNLKTLRKRSPATARRIKRKAGIRKNLTGSAVRPRLTVFKSAKHIYIQAVDDDAGVTLAAASTMDKGLRSEVTGAKKKDAAAKVGALLAQRLKVNGVETAVFDRNGYVYHGRIAAVADGAREAGIKF